MVTHHETLALQFAPELYYTDTEKSFQNVAPEDMAGLYWRPVKSSVSSIVCIQYIVYFKQQQWVPSVLDRFSGKIPGNHPNDYAPIFLYFKNQKLVRAVFDICHYEAIGIVDTPSEVIPSDEKPKFQLKNFYRGLLPLRKTRGYTLLGAVPVRLSSQRLTDWWNGLTPHGVYNDKAKLIIRKKLENPFSKISTFRDRAGKLGFLFHWIFRSAKEYQERGLPTDAGGITSTVEQGMGEKRKYFSREDIKETMEFVENNIFEKSAVPEYLALRGYRKFQRI